MRDTIKRYVVAFFNMRILPISVVYVILFAILVNRLFDLMIVKGQTYVEESAEQDSRMREIKATRGNIYDCNGVLLAYNELSNNIIYEISDKTKKLSADEKNNIIFRLLKLFDKYNCDLAVEFYIALNDKNELEYTISGNTLLNFKKEVFGQKSIEALTQEQRDMTAPQLFEYMVKDMFEISDDYNLADTLRILSVRYAIWMNRFQTYEAVTIGKDVDERIVAAVKENSTDLPGVDVSEDTIRVYKNSEYFAHVLGYTGSISNEKLKELKLENPNTDYNNSDQIGISGIESSYENYLRGKKGSEVLMVNGGSSRVVGVTDRVDPEPGNDLYLTIDSNLQMECYNLLEEHIAGILLSKITNGRSAGSRGESASDIKIPIYDVYNALISNSLIDVERFTDSNASNLEKNAYKRYKSKSKTIISKMRNYLNANSKATVHDMSKDMDDFVTYFYTSLKNKGMVLSSDINTSDQTYKNYVNGKISLSAYLQYAISQNWIDLSNLNIGDNYYSTVELYNKLLDYGLSQLNEDTTFAQMIYSYLIYHDKLSGRECCMLLFEQGCIKYNAKEYRDLKYGIISPYNFLRNKIKKLQIKPGQLGLDPCSGSLVVTDTNSGVVRAMVSYPSYDNNKMANQVDSEYFYSYLTKNTSSPLLNRPTQQKMAPGSTFKVVSAVTALEENIIDPGTTIHDGVKFKKIVPSPKCWSSVSHGNLNVSGAIEVSCNYFFYDVGYRLSGITNGQVNNNRGLNRLKKYAEMFGLTDLSGVEITESDPNFSKTDAVRSAIGQATHSYAPVQLSRYVTTVANDGSCYDLTLVDRVKNVKGDVILKNKAKLRNKVKISDSTWSAVHSGMYRVVNGSKSSISSMFKKMKVKVAGKTGTAQQNKIHANHAYFVSYAPYDDPEISVTCVIPNGYTSSNAAQTARDVYKYYFSEDKKKVSGKVKMPESSTTHTD